jgi:hypothetical protein
MVYSMPITPGSPRAYARAELARATKALGPHHPEVFAARQKYQAATLAQQISTTIPLLSREQIEDIAALLRGEVTAP